MHANAVHHPPQHVNSVPTVPIEQPLPAMAPSPAVQQLHLQQQQQQQLQEQQRQQEQLQQNQQKDETTQKTDDASTSKVKGCTLPRNFVSYCHNNYETWRPALFLEEPDDPYKRCHYAKKQVYPAGMEFEYSPEELKAKKYKKQQEVKNAEQQQQPVQKSTSVEEQQAQIPQVVAIDYVPPQQLLQEIGNIQRAPAETQEQHQLNHAYYQQQHNSYIPAQHGQSHYEVANHQQVQQLQPLSSQQSSQQVYENHENQYQDTEEEEEEDEEEEEEETADEEADDDDVEYEQLQTTVHYQQQQQHQDQQNIPNMMDDLEDQIEASTIRFSMHSGSQEGIQNKTIKIKFKKERSVSNKNHNGSNNYSAYTIENSYQKEVIVVCIVISFEYLIVLNHCSTGDGEFNDKHIYALKSMFISS